MNRVLNNAADTFTALYTEFLPKVFRYVSYHIRDTSLAEDLTSTVFEKALQKFSSYSRDKAAFSTWIFTIARNTLTDHYRTRAKQQTVKLEYAENLRDNGPQPEACAEKTEELRRLQFCMEGLETKEREIVSLKFAGEFTNRSIAGMLGLSESNIGVIVFRAVRKLRNCFKGWLNG